MAFRIAPRPMTEPKQRRPRVENKPHRQFVAELPCLICGYYETEAAHINMAADHLGKRSRGKGEKASDAWIVPLCRGHHDEQHKIGERVFWESRRLDPFLIALALWHATGDHDIASAIIRLNRERIAA